MDNIKDISKQPLIEWGGQVVITTAQLAKVYGATSDNISDNFNRNKDRFSPGKHYILLEGESLREFKNCSAETGLVSKNARQLYLWTRRGASRHCKILGTDKAWEQFDYLEDNYFDRQNEQKRIPTTIQGQIQLLAQGNVEINQRIDQLDNKLEKAIADLPILGIEENRISNAIKAKGVKCLGGKGSNAYKDKSVRGRLYCDMHRKLRREFGVSTYKAIKRSQCDTAVSIINGYIPPLVLTETIEMLNAQQNLM